MTNVINQLRADAYRLTRSTGFYIMLVLVVSYNALITKTKWFGGIVGNVSEKASDHLTHTSWSMIDGVQGSTISAGLLMYVLMGLFVIIIGYEFSQQTYKNTLISGISRLQFILSKYVAMLISILMTIAVYFITTIVTSLIFGRRVGTSWIHLLSVGSSATIAITFFISIVFSMAILLLMFTNSVIISSFFIVIFPVAVMILHTRANWKWLKYIDFFSASNRISLGNMSIVEFSPYVLTCGIILIVCIGLSLLIIREKEL